MRPAGSSILIRQPRPGPGRRGRRPGRQQEGSALAGTNRRAAQPSRRSASCVAATPKRPRRFFDYPRHGYHGLHRWLPSWRFLVGSFLTVVFLGLGAIVAAYALTPIPNPADDTAQQASTVYFANNADGSRGPVMGTFAVQRRQIVDCNPLPAY